MFRIIYSSVAMAPFTEQQLTELLQQSRRNNLATQITGMLLYRDGTFMQTLEGPEQAVKALEEKIRNDPRHHSFTTLMEGRIMQRSFGSWTMGFKRITSDTAITLPGYYDSDDLSLMSSQFLQNPSRSLDLLLSFDQEDGAP